MTKPLVLITEPIADEGLSILAESCELCTPWAQGRTFTAEELAAAHAIIVRRVQVTAQWLALASNLRVVGRHGTGLDNVDLGAATARGIPVVFTPHANANAVAEHTIGLMLALARHIAIADKVVREGPPGSWGALTGFEIRGKSLGVIGLGAIGARVAQMGHGGFQMRVIAFDPHAEATRFEPWITRAPALKDLLSQADVVTLHVPLSAETTLMINAGTLAYMKHSALLVNTSRGAVVEGLALAEALADQHILGAALDVFEEEPLPPNHPLQSAPRTLFSPHIASSTRESMKEMAEQVAWQVLQVLRGERPASLANPEAFRGGREKKFA